MYGHGYIPTSILSMDINFSSCVFWRKTSHTKNCFEIGKNGVNKKIKTSWFADSFVIKKFTQNNQLFYNLFYNLFSLFQQDIINWMHHETFFKQNIELRSF